MILGTFALVGTLVVSLAPTEQMQTFNSECAKGSAREMMACWSQALQTATDALQAQLVKERAGMPEGSRLAFELSQVEWQNYVDSWCSAAQSLSAAGDRYSS